MDTGVGPRGQQPKSRGLDFPLPSHLGQLFQGNPKELPGQDAEPTSAPDDLMIDSSTCARAGKPYVPATLEQVTLIWTLVQTTLLCPILFSTASA
ncbi:uncharacterized protein [Nothobranchius furzeri]|uniref:uncharacterized protein isoform X2 n=1 Tax=Nothobranchius furzeri TaxID=105023 RepID=UPI0039049C0D